MNKIVIIGNLTRPPEMRTTQSGIAVCSFTVAVNRRGRSAEAGQPEADFFRVSAWRELGENCNKFLAKGRKVCVVGSVSVNTYTGSNGKTSASMEVTASEVEFLSPRDESSTRQSAPAQKPRTDAQTGYQEVDEEELPF